MKTVHNAVKLALVAWTLGNSSVMTAWAAEASITLTPSQDTFVTDSPYIPGSENSSHGSDPILYAIRGAWGNYTYSLIQFDLSSYAGQNVMGPATLELHINGQGCFLRSIPRTISLHEVLIPWDGNATFVNPFSFAAGPTFGFDTDVDAAALATREVLYNEPTPYWVSWTIPAEVLQRWIDDPASNHGLIVANEEGANKYDLTFDSMEDGEHAPRLTLSLNRPPNCSTAAASVNMLWPPNHELAAIDVVGVTDPDGDPVTITIDEIVQDEPVNGLGDGDVSPDGLGAGDSTALVRAERAGGGNGRVYAIGFTATDGKGGSCSGVVTVGVPHKRGGTPVAGDTWYDSTLP